MTAYATVATVCFLCVAFAGLVHAWDRHTMRVRNRDTACGMRRWGR